MAPFGGQFSPNPVTQVVETFVTQEEADRLLAMEKQRCDDEPCAYPSPGDDDLRIPLQSADRREEFILDIHRSSFELLKGTYQNRARNTVLLARLDFGGRPHRNPDDVEVPCPHLHIFKEGYGLAFAYPLDPAIFPQPDDRWELLIDFLRFINVTLYPNIDRGLFT
jgi:hypothetical protein